MFRYEIEAPPFGRLWKQGQHSKVWTGRIELEGFDGPFDMVLRATAEGPLPEQSTALTRIVAEARALRDQAAAAMLDIYRETGLDMGSIGSDPTRIWDLLQPAFIEICDRSYYRDGRICILVVFASREEPEFVPTIETADGSYADVLSGT